MKQIGTLLLAFCLLFCAACSTAAPAAEPAAPVYETSLPSSVFFKNTEQAQTHSAALTDSGSALQCYTLVEQELDVDQMTALMTQMVEAVGAEMIDTEEQWINGQLGQDGRIVGTRALCSNGLVIRVTSKGTIQLIWPETLALSEAERSDPQAMSEACYAAYGAYLQFSDPVFLPDANGNGAADAVCPYVISDGMPTEDHPFPAQARFYPGDEEQGDRMEITLFTGSLTAQGRQPLRSAEEAAAQLEQAGSVQASCLTYAQVHGSDLLEPVYVFYVQQPDSEAWHTVICSALAD